MRELFIVGFNATAIDMKNTIYIPRYLPALVACIWAVGAQAGSALNQNALAAPAGDGWQSLSADTAQINTPAALPTNLDVAPPVVLPDPITKSSLSPGESVVAVFPSKPLLAAPLAVPAPVAASNGIPPFVLHQGEHIRAALAAWLKPQGWHLDWSAGNGTPGRLRDLVSDEDYSLTPTSVEDLLQTLLAGYGLAADVDSSPLIRRVVVRNDNNTTE